MGKLSRTKGKVFERRIAALFRERWPDAIVRRASQADRAYQSDVYVQGGPPVLARLWLECQDSRAPTPVTKLVQAERDAHEYNWRNTIRDRLPIAVWHCTGSRWISVTTRLWVIDEIRSQLTKVSDAPVTMLLDEFLGMLEAA